MKHWFRAAAVALLAPLVLTACLFTPGKFVSTLTIGKDRSFSFTYAGEVLALDLEGMGGGMGGTDTPATDGETPSDDATPTQTPAEKAAEDAAKKAQKDEQYRELAVQLAKEAGYKSVTYLGDGKFMVDYAISGTLTHNFVYPYNQDGALIFPWIAIELRGKDSVRVKAPGFAKQDMSGMGMAGAGGGQPESKIDGTFTLTTDAEVVSQNNEEGGRTAGGRTTISWKVTPRTADAPMAVLRVAPR